MSAAPFAVVVAGVTVSLERDEAEIVVVLDDGESAITFRLGAARALAATIRGLADVTNGGMNLPPFNTTTPSEGAAVAPQRDSAAVNTEVSPSGVESSSLSGSSTSERGHQRITAAGGSPADVAARLSHRLDSLQHRREH